MAYPTNIEWTDATWNPVGGCEVHSPECINCYAMRLCGTRLKHHPVYGGTTRLVKGKPVFNGMMTVAADDAAVWTWPLRWRGAADPKLGKGKPSLIFPIDMADLFHRNRSTTDIDRVIATILLSPHIGQVLSKRSDIMAQYIQDPQTPRRIERAMCDLPRGPWHNREIFQYGAWPHPRLWLGFSGGRQKEFDERWPWMGSLARQGWQVFMSGEPLLDRILLPANMGSLPKKPWIIAGGESGPDARPPHIGAIRLLRDQCLEQGLPFFFKQWGEWAPAMTDGSWLSALAGNPQFVTRVAGADTHNFGDGYGSARIGKKAAGALLDGQAWREFPEAA